MRQFLNWSNNQNYLGSRKYLIEPPLTLYLNVIISCLNKGCASNKIISTPWLISDSGEERGPFFILIWTNMSIDIYVWGEPICKLVLWRQGFRHPTRNECMGWLAQIQYIHFDWEGEIIVHLVVFVMWYWLSIGPSHSQDWAWRGGTYMALMWRAKILCNTTILQAKLPTSKEIICNLTPQHSSLHTPFSGISSINVENFCYATN